MAEMTTLNTDFCQVMKFRLRLSRLTFKLMIVSVIKTNDWFFCRIKLQEQ